MTRSTPPSTARTYAGQSAAERDAERRQRLLEASLELFGTEGYPATSVDRICSAAKVSTRHFYQQYKNKEDILLDLYSSITSASIGAVGESLRAHEGEPFEVRLTGAIRAYLGPILTRPQVARVAFVEIVGVSPRVEENRVGFRNTIIDLVEHEGTQALARGELEPRDFRFLALCLNGAVNVVVHDWSLAADHASAAEVLQDDLCRMAVRLFTGPMAPR